MKKLTNAEFAALEMKQRKTENGSLADHIYSAIGELEVSERLLITTEEWPLKNMPSHIQLPKRVRTGGRHYSFRTLADNSGFVVTRTA